MDYIREINKALASFRENDRNLWTVDELYSALPPSENKSFNSFLVSVSRILHNHEIRRISKGIYAFSDYHFIFEKKMAYIVNSLRPLCLNYISMENILSEWSIISQCPMDYYSIMTTGRSGAFLIDGKVRVNFTHTAANFRDYSEEMYYDYYTGMFKATPQRAFKDMLKSKRSTLDLVNLDDLEDSCGTEFASHYKKISKTYCDEYPFYTGIGAN